MQGFPAFSALGNIPSQAARRSECILRVQMAAPFGCYVLAVRANLYGGGRIAMYPPCLRPSGSPHPSIPHYAVTADRRPAVPAPSTWAGRTPDR
jgi:hypothetical protein